MTSPLQHPAIRWILTIIVFIASFHATWTVLKFFNRAPTPAPQIEYRAIEPEVPSRDAPGFLIQAPSRPSPTVKSVTL